MKKRIITLVTTFCLVMTIFVGASLSVSASSLPNYGIAVTTNHSVSLNVRSGPGTGYSVIDTLPPNSYVCLVSASTSGFTEIEYTLNGYDETGWISDDYISNISINGFEVGDVINVNAGSNLNVRSGAGTGYAVVAKLQPGVRVDVDVLASTPDWYVIHFDKTNIGYVSAGYLSLH